MREPIVRPPRGVARPRRVPKGRLPLSRVPAGSQGPPVRLYIYPMLDRHGNLSKMAFEAFLNDDPCSGFEWMLEVEYRFFYLYPGRCGLAEGSWVEVGA